MNKLQHSERSLSMMNRLQFSVPASKRAMQVSSHQLFVFVEGQSDKFFYGEICESVNDEKLHYQVYIAKESPFSECESEVADKTLSGKTGLLSLFNCFNKNSMLAIDFEGEQKTVVFFLDKDVDDLLGKQIDSEHLVYTKYYDLENHIFAEGDVIRGAASAIGMTAQEIREKIQNPHEWMYDVAVQWKSYVSFCFFALTSENFIKQFSSWECRYGKEKLPPTFDESMYKTKLLTDESYCKCVATVDHLYTSDQYNLVFKGKWYANLLDRELTHAAGKHEKILTCIQATLDFRASWTDHFKRPLQKLLAKINL